MAGKVTCWFRFIEKCQMRGIILWHYPDNWLHYFLGSKLLKKIKMLVVFCDTEICSSVCKYAKEHESSFKCFLNNSIITDFQDQWYLNCTTVSANIWLVAKIKGYLLGSWIACQSNEALWHDNNSNKTFLIGINKQCPKAVLYYCTDSTFLFKR